MKRKRGIVKIISLALGLAIGAVLIAKVCFEWQYDHYYQDRERVYKIITGAVRHNEDPLQADQVSGAVAPGFRNFVPGVEVATRVTPVFDNRNYYTEEKEKLSAGLLLADTSFFDIFTREIYAGDPHQVLNDWGKVMVSKSFADKLGGVDAAMGQLLYNESLPAVKLTVEGVYEDFPQNSSFNGVDILLSMVSYHKSSTENWIGNDRYHGYVKLAEGVDPATLTDAIHQMQATNQPLEEFEKAGLKLWYYLERADLMHVWSPMNRNMMLLLSLVALLLIGVSVANYVLDSITSVVQRAKEVGVRKCYGAGSRNILWLVFRESMCSVLISIFLAALLVLALQPWIIRLVGASLSALFSVRAVIAIVLVCLLVMLVSSLVPARIFMSIPVSTAFRSYRETKRLWKKLFLTLQFTFTVFLVCMMLAFAKQYDALLNQDLGYNYDNLLVIELPNAPSDEFYRLQDELVKLPCVQQSAIVSSVPVAGSSGNNVYLPSDDRELFNVADQYHSTEGAAAVLGIRFLEGREARSMKEVAVSRKFVEKMQQFVDWSDGAIGKGVLFTEHSTNKEDIYTICGVYEDYKIGGMYLDDRPSVRFGADRNLPPYELQFGCILIKVNELSANTVAMIQQSVDEHLPQKEVEVVTYADGMRVQFAEIQRIKDAILLGSIFAFIISLMGLVAYIREETRRRSAEMAIRKINGAQSREVVGMFLRDVLKLTLIAVVLGNVAAYLASDLALQMFQQKVDLGAGIYVLGDLMVVVIIVVTVLLNSLRIAAENPVKAIASGE